MERAFKTFVKEVRILRLLHIKKIKCLSCFCSQKLFNSSLFIHWPVCPVLSVLHDLHGTWPHNDTAPQLRSQRHSFLGHSIHYLKMTSFSQGTIPQKSLNLSLILAQETTRSFPACRIVLARMVREQYTHRNRRGFVAVCALDSQFDLLLDPDISQLISDCFLVRPFPAQNLVQPKIIPMASCWCCFYSILSTVVCFLSVPLFSRK